MKNFEIYDDFLPKDYFDHLDKQILHTNNFRWLFQEMVASKNSSDDVNNEQFYFICSFYNGLQIENDFYYQLRPIFDALKVKAIIRARAIMYMNQGKLIEHAPHIDMGFPHKAALIYMNTCNGYTGMVNDDWQRAQMDAYDSKNYRVEYKFRDRSEFSQGNRVESVANRLCLHDGSVPHYSTTCTDARKRLVLAVNYF
tara:strand:+ start:1270 stop:1863 length:594 start_codon:yes stop_codon:yes gene_type:complete